MTNFKLLSRLLIIFILIQFIVANISLSMVILGEDEKLNTDFDLFTKDNHLTYSIWNYENIRSIPDKPLKLTFNSNQWEALVAACMVPAFIGRTLSVPIFISDNTEELSIAIPHEIETVSSLGINPSSALATTVKSYWSKAELVFVVETIEQAYWIIPSASFLDAPILVSPSKETLEKLDTKCVIEIGNTNIIAEKVYTLNTK
jgi:hypothetical protein